MNRFSLYFAKIVSFILTIALILQIVPTGVFAENETSSWNFSIDVPS